MDSSNKLRKKYLPNLSEYLACCTSIYQRMTLLLPPTYVDGEVFDWQVSDYAKLEVLVAEQHKYTDVIWVKFKWNKGSQWLEDLEIQLKLCHDMNLAEITGFVSQDYLVNLHHPDQLNNKFSYPDEKKQIHHLLIEWLSLSLTS